MFTFSQNRRKTGESSALFLGHTYKQQVKKLLLHYQKNKGYDQQMIFDETIFSRLNQSYQRYFNFESIHWPRTITEESDFRVLNTFEEAFHQLMMELVELQIIAAERAIGNTNLKKIYIDGGFADNDLFVGLLRKHFAGYEVVTTSSPLGSALGAAMVLPGKASV